MAMPMTAPTRTQIAPPSAEAAAAWPGQEERGLDALADDRDERQDGQGRGGPVVDGPVDRRVELTADAARLAAHPEQHPGHDRGGDDHRQRFEDLLVWLLEAADGLEQDDPEESAQPERETGTDEDSREVASVAGLGQVGADDGDDQGGFDAFPETGQESAGECAYVQHGLPSGSRSRLTMVSKGA